MAAEERGAEELRDAVRGAAARRSRPPRAVGRSLAAFGSAALIAPVAMFLVGFLVFLGKVDHAEPAFTGHAEGIVALTGGTDRIADAVALLAKGRADRLLITGVNPDTNGAQLARRTPQYRKLFACCVDLGYEASNTLGNANETRRWVVEHGMHSVIVVTSNYHMPRALVEMGNALPGVQLVPFPVVSDHQKSGAWWADAGLMRLLAVEYVKYLEAIVRTSIKPNEPEKEVGALVPAPRS